MTTQENVKIMIDHSWSIGELAVVTEQEGINVLRTCHAGNLSAPNMTLLDAGINCWLVDYLNADSDVNYRPDYLLRGGNATRLAELGNRAVRTTLLNDDSGTRLGAWHADSLRDAFPKARVETASEYLTRHRVIAEQVIEATSGLSLGSETDQAAKIDSCKVGNTRMLLITFIAEALESGRGEQIQIGGSTLHTYIGKIQTDINEGFAAVKRNTMLGTELPNTIDVTIVPTAAAVFATTIDKQRELDELVVATKRFVDDNQSLTLQRRNFFKESDASGAEKRSFTRQAKKTQHQLHQEFQRIVAEHGHLIADRSTGMWTTQYDVLEKGGLYIHPLNTSLSLRRLGGMHQQIQKAKRRNSDTIKLIEETNICV